MRHGRLITTTLAALAVMAIGPAWAAAAPASFQDDSAADFGAGTPGGGALVVPAGSVQLTPVEQFTASGLPAGMTATPVQAATVDTTGTGTLKVNSGRVTVDRFSEPGQVLQFRAAFVAGEANQHAGFGDTLQSGPWAILSTSDGQGNSNGLFARASTAAGPEAAPIRIAAFDDPLVLNAFHTYRIEWSATAVTYFVDGAQVAQQPVAISTPMRPIVSDLADNLAVVTVDSLGLLSGTFQSRVLDAHNASATWGALTASPLAQPAGTNLIIETRSGQTATPDASWSAYQPLGTGGAIQSPSARYIQYRAKLSTTNELATPSLDRVEIAYDDGSGPSTPPAGGGGGGGGGQAGGTGGTSTTQQSGTTVNSAADKSKPKVSVVAKSLKASKKGAVSFTVGCPATEQSCKITLKLKNGKKIAASRTVNVKGGKSKTVTLTLDKATKKLLAKRHSLKVSTVVTAVDAAGNKRTTTKQATSGGPPADRAVPGRAAVCGSPRPAQPDPSPDRPSLRSPADGRGSIPRALGMGRLIQQSGGDPP